VRLASGQGGGQPTRLLAGWAGLGCAKSLVVLPSSFPIRRLFRCLFRSFPIRRESRTRPHGALARRRAQVELCPWRDANGNVDVRLFARDHFLGAGAGMNETYDPVAEASSFGASGTAIAQGEEFSYAVAVTLPAPGRTLTVTMVRERLLLERRRNVTRIHSGRNSKVAATAMPLVQNDGCIIAACSARSPPPR
jgi:hypothetical protein